MRVLQLSSLWPPTVLGGAELYASRLTEELRRAGHEVGVVTLGVDGPDVVERVPAWPYPLQEWAGQPAWKRAAYHARDQYDPVAARAMARAIRSFRPDVVHSHSIPGLSVAALTAPGRAGVAHVHTLHDYWLLCQRSTLVDRDDHACETRCTGCRVVSALRGRLLDRHPPEVVLAVSEAVAAEHRVAGSLPERIRVLPNPVEPAPAVAPRRRPSSPVVFGYLGQLLAIKGVRTLLEAFASLPGGAAELFVGGRGALEPDVRAASAGVTALGWLDEAGREDFFGRIDALVVPSEWKDPAPLVLNEAWARRVPVIGAAIGGIPELVAPENRALLFPSGSAAELAGRLARFAADPGAYAITTPPSTPGWADHVRSVVAAYDDARSEAGR